MANYITQAELQSYAPDLDLTVFDVPTVSGIISRASRRVDSICQVKGFDFAAETSERGRAAISAMGELLINVRRRPIYNWEAQNGAIPSVSAVRLVKGQFSVSLQLTSTGTNTSGTPLYQIDQYGTLFHYPSAYLAGTGTLMIGGSAQLMTMKGAEVFYEIDYTGGWQVIPDDIKDATGLIAKDICARRFNVMGVAGFSEGSTHVAFEPTGKSAMMYEAEEILYQGAGYARMSLL